MRLALQHSMQPRPLKRSSPRLTTERMDMEFRNLTSKRATPITPQIVTIVVDDSGSMQGDKARQASAGMRDLVISMQSGNQSSHGFRFLINLAKFGTETIEIARAVPPEDITLDKLQFDGSSGGTEMVHALIWAREALSAAIAKCQQIPGYVEQRAPTPLVVFLSDGADQGADIHAAANALRAVTFAGVNVDVVAVGIGTEPRDFSIMERIASRSSLAANINPEELSQFLATVGATVEKLELRSQLPTTRDALVLLMAAGLDLEHTPFGIRATVVESGDGTLAVEVHRDATIFVKGPGGSWEERSAGARVALCADLTFFDQQGKLPARVHEA